MWTLISIGISVLMYFLTPKPKVQEPTIAQPDPPKAENGAIMGKVYGTAWVSNVTLWYGDQRVDPIKVKGEKK